MRELSVLLETLVDYHIEPDFSFKSSKFAFEAEPV